MLSLSERCRPGIHKQIRECCEDHSPNFIDELEKVAIKLKSALLDEELNITEPDDTILTLHDHGNKVGLSGKLNEAAVSAKLMKGVARNEFACDAENERVKIEFADLYKDLANTNLDHLHTLTKCP